MIGVIASPSEYPVIREFFELFKTPWEFYREEKRYKVVLCSRDGNANSIDADLILTYANTGISRDADAQIGIASHRAGGVLTYKGFRIPIYGDLASFCDGDRATLADEEFHEAALHRRQDANWTALRIGYDLFAEIETLLTLGQPAKHAGIPTLDLHIELLRDLIVSSGLPLIEIPPVPDRYRFIACLTHDVDHPSIRNHKLDHTALGFLYRAVIGSAADFCRGRMRLREAAANWMAALKLPLVHLGLAADFWRRFPDRYREVEAGLPSTYFVLPFSGQPGMGADGPAPKFRASGYGAHDIKDEIAHILQSECDVALHGIEAWRDSSRGRSELDEIREVTGKQKIGVRMHWLYFGAESPKVLEEAGADFDSTVGYRETIGYRSGTVQAYRPIGVERLLELPLHVMDTAMFYPAYMGLSQRGAQQELTKMVDHAVRFGGCLTVNWHDRSLLPERQWNACYVDLIRQLKDQGAWCAAASDAVAWFRMRRSVVFKSESADGESVRARITASDVSDLPGLRMRTYPGRGRNVTEGTKFREVILSVEKDAGRAVKSNAGNASS